MAAVEEKLLACGGREAHLCERATAPAEDDQDVRCDPIYHVAHVMRNPCVQEQMRRGRPFPVNALSRQDAYRTRHCRCVLCCERALNGCVLNLAVVPGATSGKEDASRLGNGTAELLRRYFLIGSANSPDNDSPFIHDAFPQKTVSAEHRKPFT